MKQVLADTLVDDLMSCLVGVIEESLGRSALQAQAITSIFTGVRIRVAAHAAASSPRQYMCSCRLG